MDNDLSLLMELPAGEEVVEFYEFRDRLYLATNFRVFVLNNDIFVELCLYGKVQK